MKLCYTLPSELFLYRKVQARFIYKQQGYSLSTKLRTNSIPLYDYPLSNFKDIRIPKPCK